MASRISPIRPSVSAMAASAISERGPPACIPQSVSWKLTQQNRGAG